MGKEDYNLIIGLENSNINVKINAESKNKIKPEFYSD